MEGTYPGEVIHVAEAAHATRWLGIRIAGEGKLQLRPGQIVALTLPGGLRHPYTISGCRPGAREIDLLYRVVEGGRMTPRLAELQEGAIIDVHGTWGTPIADLVSPSATHVVGISTGTGIGPLLGYAREARVRTTLIAGFRTLADICVDYAPRGTRLHITLTQPNSSWVGLRGRSERSAPEVLDELVGAHVHLVGNGNMIRTWSEAIHRARIPVAGLTSEYYFNKAGPIDEPAVDALVARLTRRFGHAIPPLAPTLSVP